MKPNLRELVIGVDIAGPATARDRREGLTRKAVGAPASSRRVEGAIWSVQ